MEKRPNDTIEMLRAEFANVRKTAIVGHLIQTETASPRVLPCITIKG